MSPTFGTLCVVGLGHAGWPLAVAAAEAGFQITAIDRDRQRLHQLRSQREAVAGVVAGAAPSDIVQRVNFCTHVTEHTTYLVCVPTPLRDGELQYSYLFDALQAIAKHLKPGALVVIVSTVPLGFTEGPARQLLEQASGLSAEDDFLLGYAPERVDPGASWSVRSIPRVLAGTNAQASDRLAELFKRLGCAEVHVASSCRVVELTKLYENAFRFVNIAFANEVHDVALEHGLDPTEVTNLAATKPFGFASFSASTGVGGQCIGKDALMLGNEIRAEPSVLKSAGPVNQRRIPQLVNGIEVFLTKRRVPISGARLVQLGLSYKPGVSDTRNSPAVGLLERLIREGAVVRAFDPFVESEPSEGPAPCAADLEWADAVLLAVNHPGWDIQQMMVGGKLIDVTSSLPRDSCSAQL